MVKHNKIPLVLMSYSSRILSGFRWSKLSIYDNVLFILFFFLLSCVISLFVLTLTLLSSSWSLFHFYFTLTIITDFYHLRFSSVNHFCSTTIVKKKHGQINRRAIISAIQIAAVDTLVIQFIFFLLFSIINSVLYNIIIEKLLFLPWASMPLIKI